jgi:LysR family transcriptional regulator, flagellar master operon regulator
MDIGLARTYLAVVATGSFVATAEKLHITQTAVSARIRALEEQLGRPLFIRNKAGARLTVAGERFLRHATILVRTWENARQQIILPPGRAEGVSVGAELSLWDPLLVDWLIWMRRERPEIAVRAEVDSSALLLEKLRDGALDVGVLHNPPQQPELVVELLCEEKLIMVTTAEDGKMHPDDYIFVDWGPAFAANHDAAFATPLNPAVSINLGPLARTYLLTVGGAGYFRLGSVQPYIAEGRMRPVADAPEFSHSVYIVYSARRDQSLIDLVRGGLRDCFSKE